MNFGHLARPTGRDPKACSAEGFRLSLTKRGRACTPYCARHAWHEIAGRENAALWRFLFPPVQLPYQKLHQKQKHPLGVPLFLAYHSNIDTNAPPLLKGVQIGRGGSKSTFVCFYGDSMIFGKRTRSIDFYPIYVQISTNQEPLCRHY